MGKIQSVTNDNVAEYVAERKALGSEVKTEEQAKQEDGKVAATGVKPAAEIPPEPVKDSKPEEKHKGKNSVQERIDELTRKAKEADEFAEDTYEQLTFYQRRVKELEQAQVPTPTKPAEDPEPKPTDKVFMKEDGTVDQDKFLAEWGKWNRNKAIEEFKEQNEVQRREAEKSAFIAEAETRRKNSIDAARKEFPDFDEKIEEARASVEMKRRASPNEAVQALLADSDFGAHILYHLTQHPEDVERWNKMRPSQVAIAIGRLETTFTKPVETPNGAPAPKTNLPEPTPSLGGGAGALSTNLNEPMDFKRYRELRKAELSKGKRR